MLRNGYRQIWGLLVACNLTSKIHTTLCPFAALTHNAVARNLNKQTPTMLRPFAALTHISGLQFSK